MRDLHSDLKALKKNVAVLILFVYKMMIGSSKNNRGNYPRKCFWTEEKETRVKFNLACMGWAPIGLRTTGPWIFTSVLVGSIPHSYLFTSATVRVPVHTAKVWHRTNPICDVPLSKIDAAQLHSVTITVVMCKQKPYPVWFACRRN